MASDLVARRVFVGLIVLSILLLALIVQPFAKGFFLAAVLAGTLYGIHKKLTRGLRNRPNLSAGIICFGVIIALLLPLTGFTAFLISEAAAGMRFIQGTMKAEGVEGLKERLPGPVRNLSDKLMERFQVEEMQLDEKFQEQVSAQGGTAAKAVTGVVAATGSFAFQTVMMLIAFYFLLVEGQQLVNWLESVSPLKRGQTVEILREFRLVATSVLVSSVATAGVQAVAALVGYLIARVPVPFFFAAVTFFLALIPAIGAAVVCFAAAGILLVTGHQWMALFLAVWGVVVVGLVDNIVKPLLVKRGLDMHGAIVFFALLGGLAVFGTVGLLLGPLIVSFFLALIRIYERDYGRPSAKPADPPTPPT
ncbi:AI-2E family transporter [Hyalangium versicolor]|uniref:AI-2E family transporter n=1 Tax=Hyalangium versicolor TaxID=2861190 RepID=UPI001CCCFBFF|nr:AI-2E family transporter [Hyalangium versicolor]